MRSVSTSIERSQLTRTTSPGYCPGIPGFEASLNGLVTRYVGSAGFAANSGVAATTCRKLRLSMLRWYCFTNPTAAHAHRGFSTSTCAAASAGSGLHEIRYSFGYGFKGLLDGRADRP
jgi:hypothetical protein